MKHPRFTLLFAVSVGLFSPLAVRAESTPAPKAEEISLRTLGPKLSVAERVRLIEQFVHAHYFDKAGIMYSHMNWSEERPFTAADFSPTDSTITIPEPHQWMSYENSALVSGVFLTAQCYRYQATKDPEALELARQAFGSINANYGLTEHRDVRKEGPNQKAGIIESGSESAAETGFFCKPFYGQATDHTSTEQFFWPLLGLYHYYPVATPEVRERITQIFREVSRRWQAGYKINYFGDPWDMEQSNPRAQRHMFVWAVIHRMAYELTHEAGSRAEYARLDALFGAVPTPRETAWGLGRPSYTSTEDRSFSVQMVTAAELMITLEPANKERYVRAIKGWWNFSLIGQREEDFASYYFIKINSATGAWEKLPTSIRAKGLWRSPFMLQNATLPVCWMGTRERQSVTSAMVERFVPEDAARAHQRYERIFRELSKDHVKWFVDPEGVMPAELRWMLNVLQGDSLAFYSLGYWYGRANGLATP